MKPQVLFVCETYPSQPGGLAEAGRRISQALQPECGSLRRLVLDRALEPGVARYDEEQSLYRLGPLSDEDETLQMVEQFVAHLEPLDLVHAFYAGPLAGAALAGALRAGKKTVVSLRGNDLDRGHYRPKANALLHWTLARAGAITCVSREQVHKLRVWFDRRDGHYIPNSVDGDQFYPDQPLDDLPPGPLVVFSGEMRWKKGLKVVEEVARQAAGHFQLALVGGNKSKTRLNGVLEIPYQRDRDWMRRLYCRADLVWLPAFWEGMPNALLEAMACARPVLAHAVGGVPDLIGPERGWTLPLTAVEQNFEVIQQILADPQRLEVGRRAREHVRVHHSPQAERQAYLELYRSQLI